MRDREGGRKRDWKTVSETMTYIYCYDCYNVCILYMYIAIVNKDDTILKSPPKLVPTPIFWDDKGGRMTEQLWSVLSLIATRKSDERLLLDPSLIRT